MWCSHYTLWDRQADSQATDTRAPRGARADFFSWPEARAQSLMNEAWNKPTHIPSHRLPCTGIVSVCTRHLRMPFTHHGHSLLSISIRYKPYKSQSRYGVISTLIACIYTRIVIGKAVLSWHHARSSLETESFPACCINKTLSCNDHKTMSFSVGGKMGFMSILSKTVLTLLIGTATDFSSPPNQYGVRNVQIRQLHMPLQYEPMAHRWYTTYTKYE